MSKPEFEKRDLAADVDAARDHIRGLEDAPITLVEYGDFECSFCGRAEPVVRELLARFGDDLRLVWRHLPLGNQHPHAQMAAEAAEAAAAQGAFWAMHDHLIAHRYALTDADLLRYAEKLGLDSARFQQDLRLHVHAARVAEDVASAEESQVPGTPTFFINGRRHDGANDVESLGAALRSARSQSGSTRE
jgi:protein-disulfide isomerase